MVDQAPAGITLRNEHGLDCVLVAMHIEDAHEFEAHIADESDLRAAGFVRLATGSDGPSDEELWALYDSTRWKAGGSNAARRALFAAGSASRQAELERSGWRHVPDTHEVIPKGRHEWVLKADLDAAESELAATKANYAALHELHELTCKQSDEFAADAAATKAKLAEVERELRFQKDVYCEATRALGPDAEGLPRLRSCLDMLSSALASAGTDADRTEAPKCTGCSSPTKELCVEDGCGMPICARCYHDHDRHEHLPRIGDVKQPERLSVGGSPMVQWTSKLPGGTTLLNGFLLAQPDGSLRVCVDDGHYSGDVEPADALRLARRILTAYGQGETGRNNDRSASAEPSAQAYPQYGQPVSTEPPTCSAFCDIPGCPKQHGGSVESAPERQPEVERDDGSEQE